jgi:hypothetical protein
MSNEFLDATTGGYSFKEGSPNEWKTPADPPDGGGGGLAGDPVKSDYINPPAGADPQEPAPEPPPSQS